MEQVLYYVNYYGEVVYILDDCANYDEISFVGADADYYSQIIKEFIENERENGCDYFDYLYKKLFQ